MNFGHMFIKWDKQESALKEFECAYQEYEKYYSSKTKKEKNMVPIADAAMQIANIMEENGHLREAYKYVKIACKTYMTIYGDQRDNTIIA